MFVYIYIHVYLYDESHCHLCLLYFFIISAPSPLSKDAKTLCFCHFLKLKDKDAAAIVASVIACVASWEVQGSSDSLRYIAWESSFFSFFRAAPWRTCVKNAGVCEVCACARYSMTLLHCESYYDQPVQIIGSPGCDSYTYFNEKNHPTYLLIAAFFVCRNIPVLIHNRIPHTQRICVTTSGESKSWCLVLSVAIDPACEYHTRDLLLLTESGFSPPQPSSSSLTLCPQARGGRGSSIETFFW